MSMLQVRNPARDHQELRISHLQCEDRGQEGRRLQEVLMERQRGQRKAHKIQRVRRQDSKLGVPQNNHLQVVMILPLKFIYPQSYPQTLHKYHQNIINTYNLQGGMNEKQFVYVDSDDEQQYSNQNGAIGFHFADVNRDNKKLLTLDVYNPKDLPYNVVYPGLNLRGICRNPTCKVVNKYVWVRVDFGTFNIAEIIDDSACPICKQQLPDDTVKSLGYMHAKVRVEGKKHGEKNKFIWEDTETSGKFAIFEGYDGKTVQWAFLKMIVTKP